jgi:hypothetical protein
MFVKKYNLQCLTPKSHYIEIKNNNANYKHYLSYIRQVIDMIKEKNIKSNKDMVDAIYNIVKS